MFSVDPSKRTFNERYNQIKLYNPKFGSVAFRFLWTKSNINSNKYWFRILLLETKRAFEPNGMEKRTFIGCLVCACVCCCEWCRMQWNENEDKLQTTLHNQFTCPLLASHISKSIYRINVRAYASGCVLFPIVYAWRRRTPLLSQWPDNDSFCLRFLSNFSSSWDVLFFRPSVFDFAIHKNAITWLFYTSLWAHVVVCVWVGVSAWAVCENANVRSEESFFINIFLCSTLCCCVYSLMELLLYENWVVRILEEIYNRG